MKLTCHCSPINATTLSACPDLCTKPSTHLSTITNTTTTNLGTFADSIPPDNFNVETWYSTSVNCERLRKLDVYISAIGAIVVAAHTPFNDVAAPTLFDTMPRVDFKVSGRSWKVKHVLWTIFEVVRFMENEDNFAEAKFKSMLGKELLGVGQVLKKTFALGGAGPYAAGNRTLGAAEGDAVEMDEDSSSTSTKTTYTPDDSDAEHESSDIIKVDDHQAPARRNGSATVTTTSLSAKPRHLVSVKLGFPSMRSIYDSGKVLRAIMRVIIDTAQYPLDEPNVGLVYFDPTGDFHIIVRPTSEANMHKLKGYVIVYALQAAAGELADDRPGGLWTVFSGIIRWKGEIVGLMDLKAGKPTLKPEVPSDTGTVVNGAVEVIS